MSYETCVNIFHSAHVFDELDSFGQNKDNEYILRPLHSFLLAL